VDLLRDERDDLEVVAPWEDMLPFDWAGIWAVLVPDGFLAMFGDGFGVEGKQQQQGEALC